MLNQSEAIVILNVIRRLRGEKASNEVVAALTGPAGMYLETWIIPALRILIGLDPDNDVCLRNSPRVRREALKLARDLTTLGY